VPALEGERPIMPNTKTEELLADQSRFMEELSKTMADVNKKS
jgi:hypothetical protein